MTDRIKTQKAADILGVNVCYLQQQMRTGKMDLGFVSGGERRTYIVLKAKLEKFIGRELTEDEIK